MSDAIIKDMQAAIQNHLPNAVGEELQKVLADYEDLKSALDYLKNEKKQKLEELRKLYDAQERLTTEFAAYKEKHGDLEKLEKELIERKQKHTLDAAVLAVKNEHAVERIEDHKNIVSLLLRNATINRSIMENSLLPTMDGYGNLSEHSATHTSTVKEEQE